jgi:hypothetical protein
MRLLCWKLEFDSTWLPLKLTSKDNMGLGKMTRGDISSAFRLNLKKKRQHNIHNFALLNWHHYTTKSKVQTQCTTKTSNNKLRSMHNKSLKEQIIVVVELLFARNTTNSKTLKQVTTKQHTNERCIL